VTMTMTVAMPVMRVLGFGSRTVPVRAVSVRAVSVRAVSATRMDAHEPRASSGLLGLLVVDSRVRLVVSLARSHQGG
jgi:hypothetical protein